MKHNTESVHEYIPPNMSEFHFVYLSSRVRSKIGCTRISSSLIMKTSLFTMLAVLTVGLELGLAQRLLPFQGYLTDASGQAIEDGAKVVQFKIYAAPVSGTAVWAGEVHKLSINKGLVNTVIGAKASFSDTYGSDGSEKLMFTEPLYIEIAVVADNSESITASGPPLLARQVFLPATFAYVDLLIGSESGTEIITKEWVVDGSKLRINSVKGNAFVAAAINGTPLSSSLAVSESIKNGSVKNGDIDAKAIRSSNIPNGTIQTRTLPVPREPRF